MTRFLFALIVFLAPFATANAQKTRAALNAEVNQNFPDNNSGAITPQNLRSVAQDTINSIMPTAPVVSGDLVCFDGTTGLLKDCGTNPPFSFGAMMIVSNSANALAVGPNGATNPTLNVDGSALSSATGVNIKGGAAGTSPTISAISPNTNENLTLASKGSGSVVIQSTGATTISSATTPVLNLVPPSGLSGGILSDGTSLGFSQPGTSIWAKINLATGEFDALSTVASTSKTTGAITSAGGLGVAGAGWFGTYLAIAPTVVANLPTCNSALDGARAYVTNNATAVSFGGAVTTGGTTHSPVYCDGSASAWKQG